MPTQIEKTAAFLKKIAQEMPAPGDAPAFPVGPVGQEREGGQGTRPPPPPAAAAAPKDPSFMDRLGGLWDKGGELAGTSLWGENQGKVMPFDQGKGFMGNLGAAFQRGHAGTVATAGATALLAGILAVNALKKRRGRA